MFDYVIFYFDILKYYIKLYLNITLYSIIKINFIWMPTGDNFGMQYNKKKGEKQ